MKITEKLKFKTWHDALDFYNGSLINVRFKVKYKITAFK